MAGAANRYRPMAKLSWSLVRIFNVHAPATLNQGIRPSLAELPHMSQPTALVNYPNHNARFSRQDNYTYQSPGKGQVTRTFNPGTQIRSGANTSSRTAWSTDLTPNPAYNNNGSRYMCLHVRKDKPRRRNLTSKGDTASRIREQLKPPLPHAGDRTCQIIPVTPRPPFQLIPRLRFQLILRPPNGGL